MRTHGKLSKWNDERGFGFIEPASGTTEVFVHISAFPRDGVRPRIGEVVSFELEQHDGKQRAVRIMRAGGRPAARGAQPPPARTRRPAPLRMAIGLVLLAAIGWYAHSRYTTQQALAPTPLTHATPAAPRAPAAAFRCDGRKYCSQMTSCAEATFFIKQCPGTQMDGDGDGVPCESQWCSGSWAE